MKKRKNEAVRACVDETAHLTDNTKKVYKCKYCHSIVQQAMTLNVTRVANHLAMCDHCPENVKADVGASSQKAKKEKQVKQATSRPGLTLGSEGADGLRAQAYEVTSSSLTGSRFPKRQATMEMFGQALTQKQADVIIRGEVEAIVARHEPLSRVLDPFVRAAAVQKSPAILPYWPQDTKTVLTQFVLPIDRDCTAEVQDIFKRTPGQLSASADGVTCNGKSYLIYTLTKGDFTLFEDLQQLKDKTHVEVAEVDNAYRIFTSLEKKYGEDINSVSVDNAATSVMQVVIDRFKANKPSSSIILTRDPGHCLDLPAKDAAKAKCFQKVFEFNRLLTDLLLTDRVRGIVDCAVNELLVQRPLKPVKFSETRFYFVSLSLEASAHQKALMAVLPDHPEFKDFLNSRNAKRKAAINWTVNNCTPEAFAKLKKAQEFFDPFKHANKITSSHSSPMSSYPPLCQALRNELNGVLLGVGEPVDFDFDGMFGEGAVAELAELARVRFNMRGEETVGRKVAFMDPYQIWCWLCDPYRDELAFPFQVDDLPTQTNNMINFFLPEADEQLRVTVKDQFMAFYTHGTDQQGTNWGLMFDSPPRIVDTNPRDLRIKHVASWIKKTGGISRRVQFFKFFVPNKEFTKLIAFRLTAMGTQGSICVERVAKPFKNKVMTKSRNKLARERARVLLRAGLNLRFLQRAKARIKAGDGEDPIVNYDDADDSTDDGQSDDSSDDCSDVPTALPTVILTAPTASPVVAIPRTAGTAPAVTPAVTAPAAVPVVTEPAAAAGADFVADCSWCHDSFLGGASCSTPACGELVHHYCFVDHCRAGKWGVTMTKTTLNVKTTSSCVLSTALAALRPLRRRMRSLTEGLAPE